MDDPDLPSERWDGLDEDVRYPHATRRRMAIARALGVAGVLGTLALAAAAFAPRVPLVTEKVRELWSTSPVQANSVAPVTVPQLDVKRQRPAPPLDIPAAPPVLPSTAPASPPALVASAAESPPVLAPVASEPLADPAPGTPEASPAPQATSKPAAPKRLVAAPQRTRSETPLTPREIERRKQRYELWLRQQRLERIH